MRHLLLALSLALLPVVSAQAGAEPPANGAKLGDYQARELAGKWSEDGGRYTQIKVKGDAVSVTRIVDGDGEKFKLKSQGIRNGHFMFTYLVPSTGYVVTYEVTAIDGRVATYAWSNDHDASGVDEMRK